MHFKGLTKSTIHSADATNTRALQIPEESLPNIQLISRSSPINTTCCCHWTLQTAFVGLRHVPSLANQHTVPRSLICRCGATNMEQSANPIAWLRTNTRTIQAVTKDTPFQACIQSLTAAVPSDSVFRALGTNWLIYWLTYLFTTTWRCTDILGPGHFGPKTLQT